ncbi:MAG: PAS domain-containing protein [Candidatus Eremiobacteraeota bacterium]|nr:PAS domain-containing protein [Candidatus Eremiobacteraeota bacterium]
MSGESKNTPKESELPFFEPMASVLKHICILNSDLTVMRISDGMSRELGYEKKEIIGEDFLKFIDDKDGKFKKILLSVFSEGKTEKLPKKIHTIACFRRRKKPIECTPVEIVPFELNGDMKTLIFIENHFEVRLFLEKERNERVKELKCLYLLGNEVESAVTDEELLLNVAGHIDKAMQFPEITSTVITLDNKEYCHLKREKPPIRSFQEPIFIRGEQRGYIQVGYHGDKDFIDEEYALISSIARVLSKAMERFELGRERQQYTQHLETIVEERVKELEKSRLRFKYLFDNAPSGISISDREGNIIQANRAFYHILKHPEGEPVKINLVKDKLYHNPEDREMLLDMADKMGTVSNREFEINAFDGSVIAVICSTVKFVEDGKIYYESILKDVTEKHNLERELRKQKESLEISVKKRTEVLERQRKKLMDMNRQCKATSAQLRSSMKKLQTLFNAITDPVFTVDEDFTIQVTNQSPDDVGEKCYKALFKREKICDKCPALKAIERKKPASIEVERDDRFFQMQCYPVFDAQGNVEGVIEWAKDITREKNFCNQMLQADRLASLGQLVSGIGHEINNPNTFILGNIKIIREAIDDILPILDEYYGDHPDFKIARLNYQFFKDHIKLLVDDMVSGAVRIKTIVQDLRKFARKGDDRFDNEVSINQLVERSIRLVRNQVKRKASIKTDIQENLPPVRANIVGLEQVMVNLIINAYHALKNGEKGNIEISTSLDEKQQIIFIKVKDDGIGMDQATIKEIFNPFFTTKRSRGGTGLGLSIAYRIVKEHDGEIEVESSPGEGTTFIVEIPFNPSENKPGTAQL